MDVLWPTRLHRRLQVRSLSSRVRFPDGRGVRARDSALRVQTIKGVIQEPKRSVYAPKHNPTSSVGRLTDFVFIASHRLPVCAFFSETRLYGPRYETNTFLRILFQPHIRLGQKGVSSNHSLM